ncbi:MAG: cation transporter [Symploca sp. SIO1B1]|nr:cation transporter [Symploca sp. SIO1C2]NES00288.1 cation transporter [Symploca sp. SIO1B1]
MQIKLNEGRNSNRATRLILFITVWVTLIVLLVKVFAAATTRSLSLMAESLHTLLATFSAFLGLLTINAQNLSTGESVYSHDKREAALTFLLAAFLSIAGVKLWETAVQQWKFATEGESLIFPVLVSLPLIKLLGILVAISLSLLLLSMWGARVFKSQLLRFNALQQLKDIGLTVLVVLGLVGVWWDLVWLDVSLAAVLVLLTVGNFWQMVNWQLPLLVQQTAIAPEMLAQIACQVRGVTHCYQIQSRGIVGRFVYIQMHLVLHSEFAEAIDDIAEQIEADIQMYYGPIQITFYIEQNSTVVHSE